MLLLVEINVGIVGNALRRERLLEEEAADDASLDEMLRDYLGNVRFLNVCVESSFGIDDDEGTLFAESLTAGFDYLYLFIKAVGLEFLFKLCDYLFEPEETQPVPVQTST